MVIHCCEELVGGEGMFRGGCEEESEGVMEVSVHDYWENSLRASAS